MTDAYEEDERYRVKAVRPADPASAADGRVLAEAPWPPGAEVAVYCLTSDVTGVEEVWLALADTATHAGSHVEIRDIAWHFVITTEVVRDGRFEGSQQVFATERLRVIAQS
jgi:hypothetical protein